MTNQDAIDLLRAMRKSSETIKSWEAMVQSGKDMIAGGRKGVERFAPLKGEEKSFMERRNARYRRAIDQLVVDQKAA